MNKRRFGNKSGQMEQGEKCGKELEELERDIENISFRQLAELKRMCRRGYKIFSNQQEKKKKGED